jgi:hypothetical protein
MDAAHLRYTDGTERMEAALSRRPRDEDWARAYGGALGKLPGTPWGVYMRVYDLGLMAQTCPGSFGLPLWAGFKSTFLHDDIFCAPWDGYEALVDIWTRAERWSNATGDRLVSHFLRQITRKVAKGISGGRIPVLFVLQLVYNAGQLAGALQRLTPSAELTPATVRPFLSQDGDLPTDDDIAVLLGYCNESTVADCLPEEWTGPAATDDSRDARRDPSRNA